MTPEEIANNLLAAGILSSGGDVDTKFYGGRLGLSRDRVRYGLASLAAEGRLVRESGWECSACHAENRTDRTTCHDCEKERAPDDPSIEIFVRPARPKTRDPAALFLIHGMNTLGDWQQSLAWKIQLLYGYSLPVFVFKFGMDRISPFTRVAQEHRLSQLASAVREAQADLVAAGRIERCDVVAHSFGTLLLTQLLSDPKYNEIVFGRVILTGAIAPREVDWHQLLSKHRVEAVLNHRGGRDIWVRLAPWAFPDVGSSGYHGFSQSAFIHDLYSPEFAHSDFFTRENFDSVIRDAWTPFLASALGEGGGGPNEPGNGRLSGSKKYWIGRLIVSFLVLVVMAAIVGVFAGICFLTQQPWVFWLLVRMLPGA